MHGNSQPSPPSPDRVAEGLPAAASARQAEYLKATLAWALEPLVLAEDERVLQIPCGSGAVIDQMFCRWPTLEIVGVDGCLPLLGQVLRRDLGRGVYLLQAVTDKLPLAAQSMDAVVCTTAVHNLAQPRAKLAELRRVLKPGGTLLLLDWCQDYFTQCRRELLRRLTGRALDEVYSFRGTGKLIKQARFEMAHAEQARLSTSWRMMRFLCRRGPSAPTLS